MTRRLLTWGLAALALAAAGCGDSEDPAEPAGARTAAAKRSSAEAIRQAVVQVEGVHTDRRTSATGVIFEASQGLALTANHPLEDARTILVTQPDGTLMNGRLVARAQCHDLAVIKLRPRPHGVRALRFGDSAAVRPGDPITTLAFQLQAAEGDAPAMTNVRGSVAAVGVRETFAPLPPMRPLIAHQSPLTPAASGSPLLNARGEIVGVNTLVKHPRESGLEGVEYALTSRYIRTRLSQLRPGKGGALGGWQSDHDRCHHRLGQLAAGGHIDDEGGKGSGAASKGGGHP
ncbi:MAG TPA: serine protease [Baekduia sp.]|nr:serine protease [Baekduia sp.]